MIRSKRPTLREFVNEDVRPIVLVRPLVDAVGIVAPRPRTVGLREVVTLPAPFGSMVVAEQNNSTDPTIRLTRTFRIFPMRIVSCSATTRFPVGETFRGTVDEFCEAGVFVALPGGPVGLLHKSRIATGMEITRLRKGDTIEVEIKFIDAARNRVSLQAATCDDDAAPQ